MATVEERLDALEAKMAVLEPKVKSQGLLLQDTRSRLFNLILRVETIEAEASEP